MTEIPVQRVISALLDALVTAPKDQTITSKTIIHSIAKIAANYVSEYESSMQEKLVVGDAVSWSRLVAHFEGVNTSTLSPQAIDFVLESSIPRLFATDSHVRKAALVPVKAVAEHHAQKTLDRLIAATKIFQINIEFFQILHFLIPRCHDDQLKVVSLVKFLFVECIEVIMLPALLAQVCTCVVLLCCHVGRRRRTSSSTMSDDDPIAHLRESPDTNPETLTILSDLWEIISPLCWSKDLMNRGDDTEYEVVRATCSLVAVMGSLAPISGVYKNFLRSLQSAVIRLIINAKSPTQIVSAIESVRIMTISGHILRDDETTNSILPIFIDIGVSIGLVRSLTLMMNDLSDRAIGFLIDRVSHSSHLSEGDKIISLHFLADSLFLWKGKKSFPLLDSLVSNLDTICATAAGGAKTGGKLLEIDSHELFSLLNLIEHSAYLDGFLLTVPMIDLVVQSSIITDTDIQAHKRNGTHKLTSVTQKFFGGSNMEKFPRNTLKAVRTKAWQVLESLTNTINSDVVAERVIDTISIQLPFGESLRVLLAILVRIRTKTISILSKMDNRTTHELFVWTMIHLPKTDERLAAQAISLCHPSLDGLDAVSMDTCLALISASAEKSAENDKYIRKISETILSKRILQRLIQTSPDPISPLLELFPPCIPFCDETSDILSNFFVNCESEIVQATGAGDSMNVVTQLGSLLGAFARHQFPELIHSVSHLIRKETSSRKTFFAKIFSSTNNSSDEIFFAISRIAMGVSCTQSLNLIGDIIPIVRGMYLEPCLDTLRAVETGAPNGLTGDKYEINSVPVLSTLIAIEEIFSSFTDLSTETISSICSGDSHSSKILFNEIFSVILPLVLFKGQIDGTHKSIPNVSYRALRALTAIAQVQKLSTKNFDRAIQFSVSLLVHGISSFSTVDTTEYTDRIETVSDLVISVLNQLNQPLNVDEDDDTSNPRNVFLGLSRLGQSIQLAGSNGPLPILRKITTQVFANVCCKIQFRTTSIVSNPNVNWLECLFTLIPRSRDPLTELIAMSSLQKLFAYYQQSQMLAFGHNDLRSLFKDQNILPSCNLSAFVQLSLHASGDAYHDSAVFVLDLLNDVIRVRGHEISPSESSRLTSLMFSHSENHATIQSKTVDCIHTLSSIHLNSTLMEMVASVAIQRSLTDSQLHVVQSICKDKKMLIGLLDYSADIMNNSQPVDDELSQEAHAAAAILSEALAVMDSKVSQIVAKNCAQIFGTIIMYLAGTDEDELVKHFFNQIVPYPIMLDDHVGMTHYEKIIFLVEQFLQAKPNAADSLVDFFVSFISRNPPASGSSELFDAQKISGLVVIQVVVSHYVVTPEILGSIRTNVVNVLQKTQNPLMVVNGLKIIRKLISTNFFGTEENKIVFEILHSTTNIDFIDISVDIIEQASRNGRGVKIGLESSTTLITDVIANRISSLDKDTNIRIFSSCLRFIQNLCEISRRSSTKQEEFKTCIESSLLLPQLIIRRKYLSQVGGDKNLCDETIAIVEKLVKTKLYEIDPHTCQDLLFEYMETPNLLSQTSPSRSPLVIEGLVVAVLGVVEKHLQIKPKIFSRIKAFIKKRNRNDDVLLNEARRRVLAHIGDINWAH